MINMFVTLLLIGFGCYLTIDTIKAINEYSALGIGIRTANRIVETEKKNITRWNRLAKCGKQGGKSKEEINKVVGERKIEVYEKVLDDFKKDKFYIPIGPISFLVEKRNKRYVNKKIEELEKALR